MKKKILDRQKFIDLAVQATIYKIDNLDTIIYIILFALGQINPLS